MISICEDCGKKYQINLSKMHADTGSFGCKDCGHIITVYKPSAGNGGLPDFAHETSQAPPPPATGLAQPPAQTVQTPAPAVEETEKTKLAGLSIRYKIIIMFVSLVLLALAGAGYIASRYSREALANQAEDYLNKAVAQKSVEYGLIFKRIAEEAESVADYAQLTYERGKREKFDGSLEKPVLMPWDGDSYGNPELNKTLEKEKRIMQRIGLMLQSVATNNAALSLAYYGSETHMDVFSDDAMMTVIGGLTGYVPAKRPWYKDAKKAGKTIWTAPYVDANTKELVVTCATPVYTKTRKMVGVVGFDVLLNTMQKDILALDIGYSSYAFLINQKGEALVKPGMDHKNVKWNQAFESENLKRTNNADFNTIIRSMTTARRPGLGTYNAADEDKYLAYAPIKAIGATIGIVASKTEVVQPAVAIQNLIIGVCIVVLIISIVLGAVMGNSITKPINLLTERANLISKGRSDLETIEENRKDEIGVLTESFNRLVISLKVALSRRNRR